jgi:hypothetical protein
MSAAAAAVEGSTDADPPRTSPTAESPTAFADDVGQPL